MARLWLAAALLILSACGGSGGGGASEPPPVPATIGVPAPTGFSYAAPPVFIVARQIETLTPTVTGTVESYAVSPALPAGLTMDPSTGAISGTPTVATSVATYTVTASNTSGSTTAAVSLTVNAVTPAVAYESADLTFTTGVAVTAIPSNSGGAADSWSINHALPAGLVFSAADGGIRGMPTAVSAPAAYTVTAQNSGGVATFVVTIAVESGVLLDLGHARSVELIRYTNSRVFSQDDSGHWVLWDAQTSSSLANGDAPPCDLNCNRSADLAGATVAIRTSSGLELRSSADGQLLSQITTSPSWWALASDGSYVCAGDQTGLRAWSPAGDVLASRSGDYSAARIFAAANEIRVALGPVGANVVETISLANGSSALTPAFQGAFHSWFLDGARFLTHVANTVWVYSKAGVQEDLKVLPTIERLTGQGQWFWTYGTPSHYQLDIYAVGSGSAPPSATYSLGTLTKVVPSGTTIGILPYGTGSTSVIDLAGSGLAKVDHITGVPYSSTYAAMSSAQWLVANLHGVIFDGASPPGAPKYFGYGAAWSIAGSAERIALATASGSVFYFDAGTKVEEGRIDFSSSRILLSTDGTVLAAAANDNDAQFSTDRTLKIFSLPSQTEITSWQYAYPNYPTPAGMSLSGSGQVFGRILATYTGASWLYAREVTTIGGSPLWSDNLASGPSYAAEDTIPIRLSPDGSLIAVSNQGRGHTTGTNIFRNGSLATAVPGWAVGWIDDNRLLVNRYELVSFRTQYVGAVVVDGAGQQLSSPPLPHVTDFQTVTADSIYSPASNTILSLSSGAAVWMSTNPSTGKGAVAAGRVIFASGAFVRAEPY